MRSLLRISATLLAAVLTLASGPAVAGAQKALVYCPIDEAASCATVAAALAGAGGFSAGVDKGYDGTNGTVDLRTVDLFDYAVVFVPSLSDDSTYQPYSLLRDPVVQARLHDATLGRRAFYSGTPDLGTANRTSKDALIASLARWAAANYAAQRAPGLVALQDQSEDPTTQYRWSLGITGVQMVTDPKPASYDSVRTMSAAGIAILASGGTLMKYANMASFGFYFPSGAAGLSMDAVGQTGTSVGGTVVLVTSDGGNTGGAVVRTDTDDYAPGTRVVITGSGFAPNEAVAIVLHEDPLVAADSTFLVKADAQGAFTDSSFAPAPYQIDVRFILTAIGRSSGRQAQTTFTDGAGTVTSLTVGTSCGAATAQVTTGATVCARAVISLKNGNGPSPAFLVWYTGNNDLTGVTKAVSVATTTTATSGSVTIDDLRAVTTVGAWHVKACAGGAAPIVGSSPLCGNNPNTNDNSVLSFSGQAGGFAITNITVLGVDLTLAKTHSGNFATGQSGTYQLTVANAGNVASSGTTTVTDNLPAGLSFVPAGSGNASWSCTKTSSTGNDVVQCTSSTSIAATTGTSAFPIVVGVALGTASSVTNTASVAGGGEAAAQNGNNSASDVTTVVPGQAATNLTVAAATGTYGGTAALTATLKSPTASGSAVTGKTITFTLNGTAVGTATTDASGAATLSNVALTGIAAGTYAAGVAVSFAGDASFAASSGTAALTVTKATATVTVTGFAGMFDGTAHGAAGTATGVSGEDLSALLSLGASFTNVPGGTANWSFAGNANYNATNGTAAITITVAPSTTSIVCPPSATYTGQPLTPCTAAAAGAGGLNAPVAPSYTNGTNVGTANVSASYPGDANHSNSTASTTFQITQATQTITFAGLPNKTYGNADFVVTATASSGLTVTFAVGASDQCTIAAGTVHLTGAGTCTVTASQAGNGNYLPATSVPQTFTIAAKSLSVGTVTVANKGYDGNTSATITGRTLAAGGVVGTDDVSLAGGAATFATKAAGTARAVNVTGLSLTGAQAASYVLAGTSASTTADITPLGVTGSITTNNKPYDGTTSATSAAPVVNGAIAGDVVSLAGGTIAFADQNVGTAKPVTATGWSLSGADAANYTLGTVTATAANITALALTATATATNRTYDGTTTATATATLSGAVTGDVVTVSVTSASFADKRVGTGKTVAVSLSLGGAAAGNYTLPATTTTTADITARSATASVTAQPKVYDGTATATILTRTVAGTVAGDNVDFSIGAATFADKNVGVGKAVTASGLALTGADAGNYTLTTTTAATTGDITARPITVTADAQTKVYGAADPTLTFQLTSGSLVTGEDIAGSLTRAPGEDAGAYQIQQGSVSAGSNYALTFAPASLTITAKPIAVGSVTVAARVYDGTTAATITGRTLGAGIVGSDDVSLAGGTAAFVGKAVGTGKTVNVTGLSLTGAKAANYALTSSSATTTADITAKPVTGSITTNGRVYDATTVATSSAQVVTGAIAGDNVSLVPGTLAFADKNVGTAKPVQASSWALGGTDAGNYALGTVTASAADITPLGITATATASSRVYDGTVAAIATATPNGVLSGDAVTVTVGSATFANKNVGTAKTVTVNVTLAGADAANYTVTSPTTATAAITARALVVSAAGVNRQYDGTTSATVTLADNRVSGDVLTTSYASASFADKNVGTGKTVTVSGISASGADAGNYTANTGATTTATVTARLLTVSATGVNRIYDGTTSATVTLSDDRVAGDVLTTGFTSATFGSRHVGTAKPVAVAGISISGTDAGNYTVNASASATADITPRALAVSAAGVNKVYDGTTTATVTLSDNRIAGDAFSVGYASAVFADKNVGTGKAVSVSGIALTGSYAGDYTANASASTTADITMRPLAVTATANSKVYDGTNAATVALADNRVPGDVLSTGFTSATFADRIVGAGKTVTVSGIAVAGADAGNYTANTSTTATASITALAITGSITAKDKVYDGTTSATIGTRSLAGMIAGDAVSYSGGTATFVSKSVGTGKTVNATGLALSGADAGNYTVNATATTTAAITARPLTVTATGVSRVFNGTTAATVTLADDRVSGDQVTDAYTSAAFVSPNVGTGITVNVSGISISGGDAGNYALVATTAVTTASITIAASTTALTTVSPPSQQYSDLATFTATVTGAGGPPTAGSVQFKVDGVNAGGAVTAASPAGTYTLANYRITQGPGSHTVTAAFTSSDPNYTGSSDGTGRTLTVLQEDARATYTGQTFASTGSSTATTATVTLSATIQDITAVTGDPQYDGNPGDIRNATAKFVDRSNGTTLCSANIGLVVASDTKTGVVTCNFTASTGNATSQTYAIGVVVGGHYLRDAPSDNTLITVSQSIASMITGGGFLINSASSGKYPGQAGLKSNYGFNVKYNKQNTNLQGNMNIIVRNGGRTYQIKANAMTSLGVVPTTTGGTAQFAAKASIQDITDPLNAIAVDGNATLQVSMTDNGSPGTNDAIAIAVFDKSGGLWFSSNWSGTRTNEQTIAGGDLVVR